MAVARIRGTRIHYRSAGHGEAVLLIHGLGSSGEDWELQVRALSRRFRVIVPDLRGSGRSGKPQGPYQIADFAADLWSLLRRLGVERTHVVGFSLGGAVALEMALTRPDAVSRLVMINALPHYSDTWRKWVEAQLTTGMVRILGLQRTAQLVAKRMFPHDHQAALRERTRAVIGKVAPRPYLETVRALVAWHAVDRLDRLRCPTLIIAAEHDYTPLQEKRDIAARLGAEFALIQGSRHGTPFDSVGAVNACLSRFLGGRSLPPDAKLRLDPPEVATTLVAQAVMLAAAGEMGRG
jgi:pimeloyl-ACP methyl ester carboxylesterase